MIFWFFFWMQAVAAIIGLPMAAIYAINGLFEWSINPAIWPCYLAFWIIIILLNAKFSESAP